MKDIVERLRKPLLCEETLEKVLDPIAKLYRAGDTGSLPRDIFESFTDDLDGERDEAAALIASQAQRIRELEEGLRPLVEACYDEMHGTVCDDERDDEPVATTRDVAGNISHSAITFGMIRRARSLLSRKGGE